MYFSFDMYFSFLKIFTSSHSATSISFLDVKVSLDQFGKVETDLYTKPTGKHQYLLQS